MTSVTQLDMFTTGDPGEAACQTCEVALIAVGGWWRHAVEPSDGHKVTPYRVGRPSAGGD